MSLQIHRLTKSFGRQQAVEDISFAVKAGEIVGFLGPNGAGKSTTMKMITGYIPPSSGRIEVGGFDVVSSPIQAKRITGYLPEHNPLYLDMYVHEYLRFVGGLYGFRGRPLRQRVEEMISLCGLGAEQNKKLEALSKGYRQRAGLAQALLHDPQVLILDEPTSGLDPNQIIEIRNLIREISKDKTVLFSSHIMQEVQALCNRVVVINKGKIVANDQLSNLLHKKTGNVLIVEFEEAIPLTELKEISGVLEVVFMTPNKYKIFPQDGVDLRSVLFSYASKHNRSLTELKVEENSMEAIFKELTTAEKGS